MIIEDSFRHSLEGLGPGQPGDQGPTGPALHGQRPVHDEGRKEQCVPLAESDPVAGPLAIKDLDPAAVISAAGQLDDHRYFAQAHRPAAEVHVPVVLLARRIARQLQLTHFVGKPKPVPRIVEHRDITDSLEYPSGLGHPRNPEQITVSDQTAIAPRHPALECTLLLMRRNDALALLRTETPCEYLAVIKSFPHQADPLRERDAKEYSLSVLDCQINYLYNNACLRHNRITIGAYSEHVIEGWASRSRRPKDVKTSL